MSPYTSQPRRKSSFPRTTGHTSLRKRSSPPRRKWAFRIALVSLLVLAGPILWAALARQFAPRSNTSRTQFDAILILGTPADSDGNPTPELQDRITEGVHEYERGVAPRLIVSGAAAHNQYVEAEVMARVAQAQGVPASVIFEEPQALDTIQNACYSARILKEHGWHSVEVVSSAPHLPRAALIFSRLSSRDAADRIEFRTHVAPINLTPGYYNRAATILEVFKTSRYLLWSSWAESCAL